MQICEAGKVSVGRRRIKCRWKRKQGFFWKRALSECQGCDPETPTSSDANLSMDCAINTKGFNVCMARCTNGGKILGGKKLKLKCKCPRSSNGTRTCGWIGRKSIWTGAQLSSLTCEGGNSSSSSGSSGSTGGTSTHCATGSTVITSTGITCSDGSTPIAGSGGSDATGATAAPTVAATPAATAAPTVAPTVAATVAATVAVTTAAVTEASTVAVTTAVTTAATTARTHALNDSEIAKFVARNNMAPWQLPSSCGASCAESEKTFLTTEVSLTVDPSDDSKLIFTSNGIPDHNSCAGPPNSAITAQSYSYTIPRNPVMKSGTPDATWTATNMGAVGFAINGVPIFNPYDSSCCDAGLYELTSLDACYAHPTPTQGNYHYHVHSPCLAPCKGESELVGFALDGFPIMGPGINPATNAVWSQSDMDICGGKLDADGIYRYYTTVDFPYFLQCYRGETSSTTGGQGIFTGTCGLNGSTCSRETSSGRKKRSTGNATKDWINSLFEMEQPSGYAKRILGDMHSRKKRSVAQLTSVVDAYIALWGSQQAVTQQEFLDNLVYTCDACNNYRDLESDCSGKMTDCNSNVNTYADLASVAAPGSSSGGGGGPPSGK